MKRLARFAVVAAAAAFALIPFRADARCFTPCAPGLECAQVCALDVELED